MITVQVELLTDQGNNAVLRLPERKTPGVLVQGDSLNRLASLVTEAMECMEGSDAAAALEAIEAVANELQEMRDRYEAALSSHSIPLPY